MPDLLAHALVAYAAARVASLRWPWLTRPYVTAAMAGAFVPDLAKARLLVPGNHVSATLGVPFAWQAIHALGGALALVLVGATLVAPRVRRPATLALGLGAGTHLLADALLRFPSGRSHPLLWPLTRWHPPDGGLFVSTDPHGTVAAAVLAVAAWGIWRWRGGDHATAPP